MMVNNLNDRQFVKTWYSLVNLVMVHKNHAERWRFGKRTFKDCPKKRAMLVHHRKVVVRISDGRRTYVMHTVTCGKDQ